MGARRLARIFVAALVVLLVVGVQPTTGAAPRFAPPSRTEQGLRCRG